MAKTPAPFDSAALYVFAVVGTYGKERTVRGEMLNRIGSVAAAGAGGKPAVAADRAGVAVLLGMKKGSL